MKTPDYHRAGRPVFVRRFACWLFKRMGWTLEGSVPCDRKLILVVGPHTSNWDFVICVLAMLSLDIRLHFLAKHSLFKKPLGTVMTALGGIPINRSKPEGFVDETAGLIRKKDELILAITPEGTRSKVSKLKTGFSRIAREVPCPLMPILLDFGKKEVLLMDARDSSPSPEQDALIYREIFTGAKGKNPYNF